MKTGDSILNYGVEIGKVTRGSLTPTTKHSTALGYISPEFAIPVVNYTIKSGVKEHSANLFVVPIFDSGKTHNKGK